MPFAVAVSRLAFTHTHHIHLYCSQKGFLISLSVLKHLAVGVLNTIAMMLTYICMYRHMCTPTASQLDAATGRMLQHLAVGVLNTIAHDVNIHMHVRLR